MDDKNLVINNDNNSCASISINWYPGHMAKTKRKIKEDLKLIDVVVELLDSRIPISSQNPDFAEITNGKKKIVILNKSDLSDEKQNKLWVEYFKQKGIPAILTDANTGRGIKEAIKIIEQTMKEDLDKLAQKGRVGRKIRAMILGIPNVGKSSLINRIAKKGAVQVANRPGVTRQNQWIRINDNIELLDTPGVLWPKFESQEVALNLAFTGTIKDNVLERIDIAYYLIKYLLENYRENLCQRYKLKPEEVKEILNRDEPENVNIYDILLLIGKKRGAIMSGGNIDEEKTARIILDEFRSGTIGKITLEKCVNGDELN